MHELLSHIAMLLGTLAGGFLVLVLALGALGFLAYHVLGLGFRLPGLVFGLPARMRVLRAKHRVMQAQADARRLQERRRREDLHAMAGGIADLTRIAPDERRLLRRR